MLRILRKALLGSAFFVWGAQVAAACLPTGAHEVVEVGRIFDGDTLQLTDGRHVRLIGVNTPELGHGKGPDEPFALAATRRLARLAPPGSRLSLYPGVERRDHYGRTLAHLVTPDGTLLAEDQIRSGLGYALAIPPNIRLADCLFSLERKTRREGRGLWQHGAVRSVANLRPGDQGFGVWRGRVTRSGTTRKGAYLELDHRLFVWLDRTVERALDRKALAHAEGREVELRGWLIDRLERGGSLKKGYRRWFVKITDNHQLVLRK